LHSGWVWVWVLGTYIPVTRPIRMFWNRRKLKLIPKPSQKGENPSNWIWFRQITSSMGFVVMLDPQFKKINWSMCIYWNYVNRYKLFLYFSFARCFCIFVFPSSPFLLANFRVWLVYWHPFQLNFYRSLIFVTWSF